MSKYRSIFAFFFNVEPLHVLPESSPQYIDIRIYLEPWATVLKKLRA